MFTCKPAQYLHWLVLTLLQMSFVTFPKTPSTMCPYLTTYILIARSIYLSIFVFLFRFADTHMHTKCLLKSHFTQMSTKHIFPFIHSILEPCIILVLCGQFFEISHSNEILFVLLIAAIKIDEIFNDTTILDDSQTFLWTVNGTWYWVFG